MMEYFEDSDKLLELITDFGIAIASALAVLIIGLFVIKKLTKRRHPYRIWFSQSTAKTKSIFMECY